MTYQFRSYLKVAEAWLDGQPIQYEFHGEWEDYEDSYPPIYDDENWRIRPGNHEWARFFLDEQGTERYMSSSKKWDVLLDGINWISEPILVTKP